MVPLIGYMCVCARIHSAPARLLGAPLSRAICIYSIQHVHCTIKRCAHSTFTQVMLLLLFWIFLLSTRVRCAVILLLL